jgi:hypothetical protein
MYLRTDFIIFLTSEGDALVCAVLPVLSTSEFIPDSSEECVLVLLWGALRAGRWGAVASFCLSGECE